MQESVGQRIARYRSQNDWTQEQLAERIAVSRVAISHLEMGLSIPSERTVLLMASAFKCMPQDLVAGTTYPQAKAERLPTSVAWYTYMDNQQSILRRDLLWLARLENSTEHEKAAAQVVEEWLPQILSWIDHCFDEEERKELLSLREQLLKETHSGDLHIRKR
jgi:transcriptional regulator with XRE-family HTH domain